MNFRHFKCGNYVILWVLSRGIFKIQDFLTFLKLWSKNSQNMKKIPNLYQELFFFYPEILIFCKTSMNSFMSFFAFYYMIFPKFKIPENFWSYGAKTGRNSGNFQIFMENWNFAYEFFIFLKFRSWILWHFSRSFTWNFQNSKILIISKVMCKKLPKKSKFPLLQKLLSFSNFLG